jgi:hypothetical protein
MTGSAAIAALTCWGKSRVIIQLGANLHLVHEPRARGAAASRIPPAGGAAGSLSRLHAKKDGVWVRFTPSTQNNPARTPSLVRPLAGRRNEPFPNRVLGSFASNLVIEGHTRAHSGLISATRHKTTEPSCSRGRWLGHRLRNRVPDHGGKLHRQAQNIRDPARAERRDLNQDPTACRSRNGTL